jgi:hypothetical protein
MTLADVLARATSLRQVRDIPATIDALVLIGSTCAGKSTLANAVRAAAIPSVDVPQRFVTRATRPDDVAAEAHYVTSDQLDAAIADGSVCVHWSRTLAGTSERYAFATPQPGALPFYSANNAICLPGNVRPEGVLAHALIIGVHAPDALREKRLVQRSPALLAAQPDEARARLAEPADAIMPFAHVVVDASIEAVAPAEIVELVRAVAR